MKHTWLALAIAGTVVPCYFFLKHVGANGADLLVFLGLAFANPVASGFAADLSISSFVFWAYMFSAGPQAPKPWVFILLNLLVGLSCALPAYLYWRSRRGEAPPG